VITPPAHADMAPYPRGMVITPPDPHDDMVVAPGARGLPAPSLSKQLGAGLHRSLELGVDALTELLRPPRSL
jgi:hypothetical protein